MFQNISDALVPFLKEKGFEVYLGKVWVYRQKCLVVDFIYKGCKFAFDVSPAGENYYSLNVAAKRVVSGFSILGNGQSKKKIAAKILLDEVCVSVYENANSIFESIDAQLGRLRSPPDVEAAISPPGDNFLGADKAPTALKVGVLTLPFNANIGGNIQGYAVMEVLRQLGHQPVLINRRRSPKGVRGEDAAAAVDARSQLVSNSYALSHAPNRAFIEAHITPVSREFYSTAHLSSNIHQYDFDAVIVGSDQVWRPKYAKSVLFDFFLRFIPEDNKKIKRISYAASFGTTEWEFDAEQTTEVASLISRFDAVSVREDSGVALCRQHLGVDAQHVLDPTLLLTPDHYAQLFSDKQRHSNEGQLLAYILDRNEDKLRVIQALSERLSVGAFSTSGLAFGSASPPDGEEGDKSVEGWLAAIHEASFVVTDSFHGAVFSILFNRPFIAYGNPKRGMARFASLVRMLGLEDRLVVKSTDIDLDKMLRPIDWDAVNARLAKLRTESKHFLVSALSGQVGPRKFTPPGGKPAAGAAAASAAAKSGQEHPLNVFCTGCGVCVSESKGTLRMDWNEDGFLVPRATGKKVPAQAVRVCPFNPRPEREVADEDALADRFLSDARYFDPKAGRFEAAYIGYSDRFRPTSSSGGMATYIFHKLLEDGHVDYLFVVRSDGSNGYQYQIVQKNDDILSMSKTRYYPVSMEELFSVIDKTDGRVAVSGVACFIKAIRLKQHYHPELRQKIPFLVGIICGGLKSRYYTDFLAESAGIHGPYTSAEYRVKDPAGAANHYSFSAVDEKSEVHTVKMGRLGDMWGSGLFKSRACDFCTDVLTELADISLGDAWLPTYKRDGMGNSVVVTRSALAEKIIRSGIASGELLMKEVPVSQIVQSQNGGLNHKQNTLKFRTWMARYFTDQPIPVVRARLMKSSSVPDALIQIHKERTRSKSLAYWRASGNVETFNRMMHASRNGLKAAKAARQDARDAGGHPLTKVLEVRHVEALRGRQSDLEKGSRIMWRWLRRRVRGQQFTLDALRSALLGAEVVHVQEPAKGKTDLQPMPPSQV